MNKIVIIETERSLKKGPVIRNSGIRENNVTENL